MTTVHLEAAEDLRRIVGDDSLVVPDAATPAEALRRLLDLPAVLEVVQERRWAIEVDGRPVSSDGLARLQEPASDVRLEPLLAFEGPALAVPAWALWVQGALLAYSVYSIATMPGVDDYGDRESPENRQRHIFSGPVNSVEQGGPVPLVYGTRVRVGSTVVSASTSSDYDWTDEDEGDEHDRPPIVSRQVGGGAGRTKDDNRLGSVAAAVGYDDPPDRGPDEDDDETGTDPGTDPGDEADPTRPTETDREEDDPPAPDEYRPVSLDGPSRVALVDLLGEGPIEGLRDPGVVVPRTFVAAGTPSDGQARVVTGQAARNGATDYIEIDLGDDDVVVGRAALNKKLRWDRGVAWATGTIKAIVKSGGGSRRQLWYAKTGGAGAAGAGGGEIRFPDESNRLASVFLDGTPLRTAEGRYNFSGLVDLELMRGRPDQPALSTISAVENQQAVDVALGTAFTARNKVGVADAVRVTLRCAQLWRQPEGEDVMPALIRVEIALGSDSNAITYGFRILDKRLAPGEFSVVLPLGAATSVSVRRTTAPAADNDDTRRDEIKWASVTWINRRRQTYRNSAIVGLTLDGDLMGGRVPKREYEIAGLRVALPNGYNRTTRSYPNLWDGTMAAGGGSACSCPAWNALDFLRSVRGRLGAMGDVAEAAWKGRRDFYAWARWCDEDVPVGDGTDMEPRWAFDHAFVKEMKAGDLLDVILSAGRAGWTEEAGALRIHFDKPADPAWLVASANVENGEFLYGEIVPEQDKVSAVAVTFQDREDGFRAAVEHVISDELVARRGLRRKDIVAVGCTSRGQAHRLGRAELYEQEHENRTIEFTATWDNALMRPGDIVSVADEDITTLRLGRRIVPPDAPMAYICLDQEIPADVAARIRAVTVRRIETEPKNAVPPWSDADRAPGVHRLSSSDGCVFEVKPEDRRCLRIRKSDGGGTLRNYRTDKVAGVVILEFTDTGAQPTLWRVEEVEEVDFLRYRVKARQHDPSKWNVVESRRPLASPERTRSGSLKRPTSIDLDEQNYVDSALGKLPKMVLSAECEFDPRQRLLDWQVRFAASEAGLSGLPWERLGRTAQGHTEIKPSRIGWYQARVRRFGGGVRSGWTESAPKQADGVDDKPPTPTGGELQPELGGYLAQWAKPAFRDWFETEVYDQDGSDAATTTPWEDSTCRFRESGRITQQRVYAPGEYEELRVYVVHRDRWGNYSDPWTGTVVPTRPDSVEILVDERWIYLDDNEDIPDPNSAWDDRWVYYPLQVYDVTGRKRVVIAEREARISAERATYRRWTTREWSNWSDTTKAPRKDVRFHRTKSVFGEYDTYTHHKAELGYNNPTQQGGGAIPYDSYPPAAYSASAKPQLPSINGTVVTGPAIGVTIWGFMRCYFEVAVYTTGKARGGWSRPKLWARWGANAPGDYLVLYGAEARALELLGGPVTVKEPPSSPGGGGGWRPWQWKGVISGPGSAPDGNAMKFAGNSQDLLALETGKIWEIDIRAGQSNRPPTDGTPRAKVGDLYLGMRRGKPGDAATLHTVLAAYGTANAGGGFWDRGSADAAWSNTPIPAWFNENYVEFADLGAESTGDWIDTTNGQLKFYLNANDRPGPSNWGFIWAGVIGSTRTRIVVCPVGSNQIGWYKSTKSVSGVTGQALPPAKRILRYRLTADDEWPPEPPDHDDVPSEASPFPVASGEASGGQTNGWAIAPPRRSKARPHLWEVEWDEGSPWAPWARPVLVPKL